MDNLSFTLRFGLPLIKRMHQSLKHDNKDNYEIFKMGKASGSLPDGKYEGLIREYKGAWKGKNFVSENATGINIWKINGKLVPKFPFKVYHDKGLKDKSTEVIKIDYNVPQNPFYVRLLLDEIVEVKPHYEYLGKAYIRMPPSFSFTLGYFRLKKEQNNSYP